MTGKPRQFPTLYSPLTIIVGLFFLVTVLGSGANAQLTRSARIILDDPAQATYIGQDSYVTIDPENEIAFQVITNRHENNLRGERQNQSVIRLDNTGAPAWVLFSVTNNTDKENWILDFGRTIDGRTAVAQSIDLYRAKTKENIGHVSIYDKEQTGKIINRRAMRIKISAGETELFALHVTPSNTIANTIAPYLIESDAYLPNMSRATHLFENIFFMFLWACVGVFVAISYIRQNPHYLMFSGYFIINTILFYAYNSTFFAPFEFAGEALSILQVTSVLFGIIMTRAFFRIGVENQSEILLLRITAFIAALSSILSIFFLTNSVWGDLALYIPMALSMLIIAALAFFKGQEGQYAGVHYAASWLVMFTGLFLTALSSTKFLPANTIYLNGYWFALIPQGILFLLSVKKRIEMVQEEERHRRSRESRAVQSRARLRHSKESADQARLLRVIERERELMAELREREMQRAEEMRVAKETAVDANRAKSAFLAVVSHEIRTPMTGILGILRLLSETSLNSEQQDYLMSIQTSGETMMALLNDILDFEKIERGSMDLEEIDLDLAKLVQGVVTLMSGHAADKGLELKADIPEDFPHYLIGDPTRLRQILLNLVNNAIKFTQHGGVTIELKATPLSGQSDVNADYEIYIGVHDTGIGISEEAQRKLFSPFEQADNTVARRFGGTGLGLAICKRLVEAMGGAISVKSEEGQGSTFFFSILMDTGHADGAERVETPQSFTTDIPPMNILVIEDNEMNQKVMSGFLEKGGHSVHLAESGENALTLMHEHSFDVVFTDVNLQGMDGMETTRNIRTLPDKSKAETPIIAVSGNVTDEDIRSYEHAGMNGFVAKPISPEKLYEILENIHNGQLMPQSIIASDNEPSSTDDDAPTQSQATDNGIMLAQDLPEDQNPASEPILGEENDQDVSSLQEYAQNYEEEDNYDSFEEAKDIMTQRNENEEHPALDETAIQGLLDSLGADALKGLMDGYLDKADEIVAELMALQDSDDAEAIRDRAHEIKGMAANFGVHETSVITDIIETAAQNNDIERAHEHIKRLPEINQRAKDAIKKLLEK